MDRYQRRPIDREVIRRLQAHQAVEEIMNYLCDEAEGEEIARLYELLFGGDAQYLPLSQQIEHVQNARVPRLWLVGDASD